MIERERGKNEGGERDRESMGPGGMEVDLCLSRLCLALSLSLFLSNTNTHKHSSGRALIPALRQAYAGPGSPAQTQQFEKKGKRKSIGKALRKFEVSEQVSNAFYQSDD